MTGIATRPKQKPDRDQIPDDANLCEYCTAKCCRYFALPIDKPKKRKDFEFIRWYLVHERAAMFVEDGVWYLLVHTVCQHLQDDHRCGIYETRPQICRDYTTDECEYEDEYTYEQYFDRPEQIAEYAEAVLEQDATRGIRSPQPPLLPVMN